MGSTIESMISSYRKNWGVRAGILIFLLTAWLRILSLTDALLSPYILVVLLGLYSFGKSLYGRIEMSSKEKTIGVFFSIAFSSAVCLASYRYLLSERVHILDSIVLFLGGCILGWYVLLLTLSSEEWVNKSRDDLIAKNRKNAAGCFLMVYCSIILVYLLTLYCCLAPGILTPDSISQVGQSLSGSYSNHHPFWHTMMIKTCMDLGMTLFHNINMAVTTYCVFQVLCLAAIFSYVCMTLYEIGIRRIWIAVIAMSYAILPHHLLYSVTVWKDVLFGGSVTLFTCALYRIIKNIGKSPVNDVTLAIGALGCCVLRSNGMAAFAFTFLVFAIFFWKKEKKAFLIMLSVIVVAFVLKYPVLKALNVQQPDTIEYLSIPAQQIARVIVEGKEIDENDLLLIEQVVDIEAVKNDYKPYISDPIKDLVRKTGEGYLTDHKKEYFSLWVRLALKYPTIYLSAWIDQTKGYWNGGYKYWVVAYGVNENEYSIVASSPDNIVKKIVVKWVSTFFNNSAFEPFRSIGLHVWIIIACGVTLAIRKRQEGILVVLPLAVILTLLISTPVFSEFRYAYAIFTTLPLIFAVTFFPRYIQDKG